MAQVFHEVVGEKTKPPKQGATSPGEGLVRLSKPKPTNHYGRRTRLGEYLMNLARVADAMEYEADERLLRETLNTGRPVYIRRTLDQYFSMLDETSARDRDQVVYRRTRGRHHDTRVVMVDQLWLWVLDDNTIITSFPRSWGHSKRDRSGARKSIRERLINRSEGVESIYHLALMIIDQCSRDFFDDTQPLDGQPEALDLFHAAIRNVMEYTSIVSENFWRSTAKYPQDFLPGSKPGHQRYYLDINPEGILLKEAQDIAEELKIMLRVYHEQLIVVGDFRRHLDHLGRLADEPYTVQRSYSERGMPQDQRRTVIDRSSPTKSSQLYADELLESIHNRELEILDLEGFAQGTYQKLQGLLSLKQQQASMLGAKASITIAEKKLEKGQGQVLRRFFITVPLALLGEYTGLGALWERSRNSLDRSSHLLLRHIERRRVERRRRRRELEKSRQSRTGARAIVADQNEDV